MNIIKSISVCCISLCTLLLLNSCRKDDPEWNLEKTLPKIKTLDVLGISSNAANVRAKIVHNGGYTLDEKGICYSTSVKPTVENSDTLRSSEKTESFSITINNLLEEKKYYVRSFARNRKGLVYGEELQFETKSNGKVETVSSTNITHNSALLKGKLISVGGSQVLKKGFLVSENSIPNNNDLKFNHVSTSIGDYEVSATGLKVNTKYYFRAYIETGYGFSYGDVKNFTTASESLPVVTTSNPVQLSAISFRCDGNVTSEGSSAVTQRGVCYSTSPNPTIGSSVKYASGSGLGSFTCVVENLQSNGVIYYVRAFAINNLGPGYGAQVTYTTSTCLPTVSTTGVTSITATSAITGGNISNNGGFGVTLRGVVWSTAQNPTINLSTKTVDGSGNGLFSSSITGLVPNTTYYVRAYATNSCGTNYGTQLSFTTSNSNYTGTILLGNGNSVDGVASEPWATPFGTYFSDSRHLYLMRKSELNSEGVGSGNIRTISFDLVSKANIIINNFKIKIGTTLDNEVNSNTTLMEEESFSVVPFNLFNAPDWINFNLNSTYFWNGSRNLLIEVCFDNTLYNQNTTVYATNVGFRCTNASFKDNDSGCTLSWEHSSFFRPNMKLTFE